MARRRRKNPPHDYLNWHLTGQIWDPLYYHIPGEPLPRPKRKKPHERFKSTESYQKKNRRYRTTLSEDEQILYLSLIEYLRRHRHIRARDVEKLAKELGLASLVGKDVKTAKRRSLVLQNLVLDGYVVQHGLRGGANYVATDLVTTAPVSHVAVPSAVTVPISYTEEELAELARLEQEDVELDRLLAEELVAFDAYQQKLIEEYSKSDPEEVAPDHFEEDLSNIELSSPLLKGNYWEVVAARANTQYPALEYLKELDDKDRSHIVGVLKKLADIEEGYYKTGSLKCWGFDGFNLCEIKRDAQLFTRLFFFKHDGKIVLLNGFNKQANKTSNRELEQASRLRSLYLAENPHCPWLAWIAHVNQILPWTRSRGRRGH